VLWCLPLEQDGGSLEGRRGRLFVGPLRFLGLGLSLPWATAMRGVICDLRI
jgi:hypothetical protein